MTYTLLLGQPRQILFHNLTIYRVTLASNYFLPITHYMPISLRCTMKMQENLGAECHICQMYHMGIPYVSYTYRICIPLQL